MLGPPFTTKMSSDQPPTIVPVTLAPNDTCAPPTSSVLANNCLYFIQYQSNRSDVDSTIQTVSAAFSDEEINAAYTKCKDLIPDTILQEQPTKSLSSLRKVSYVTKWLRTCSVEMYADDPYNLPPKGPADLSLPAVYHTAEN